MPMRKFNLPLQYRLLLTVFIAVVMGFACSAATVSALGVSWYAWIFGAAVGMGVAGFFAVALMRQLRLGLNAVDQGLLNLLDNDFSVTLAGSPVGEIDRLIQRYNRLTDALRRERQSLYQRELLLDTVIEHSSLCVLIADDRRRVIFANHLAGSVTADGQAISGRMLADIFAQHNPDLMRAIERLGSGVFPLRSGGDDLYHLFCGQFILNAQRHTLILMKEMTRELGRQEAAAWKNVIRVISHELNNSLAPISSLAHSGQILLGKGQWQQLPEVLAAIGERAEHLKNFVSRYAEIAKLPVPQKVEVDWRAFIQGLNFSYAFRLDDELPIRHGYFDPGQIQHLLLNLLKNAAESGSIEEEIVLSVKQTSSRCIISVADRGSGMPGKVLKNAFLPFYSTKSQGKGIGLPLCREIVEAHDGVMTLSNRASGGLRVTVTLPGGMSGEGN